MGVASGDLAGKPGRWEEFLQPEPPERGNGAGKQHCCSIVGGDSPSLLHSTMNVVSTLGWFLSEIE